MRETVPDTSLFVSHKHSDTTIARVLGSFVEGQSQGRVRVFLSSSPDFQGPRFGKSLNAQLTQALWNTEVLLLVYTSADEDWSYCMWECGVATKAQSPSTSLIVFQCGQDVPSPFQDVLRVNARSYDDIKRFTTEFMRDPDFFPRYKKPLAPDLKDTYIESAAKELFSALDAVLPPPGDGQVEEWSAWPFLRVQLPTSEVDRLQTAVEGERMKLAQQVVRDHAIIGDSDTRSPSLFGRAGFPSGMKFEALLHQWQERYTDADASWFDSCCEQIVVAAQRGFPIIRWSRMRDASGESEFTPVLTRVRRIPFGRTVEFDLYFYNLSDPRAMPVTTKMIPVNEFFHKKVGDNDPASVRLTDLLGELEARGLNRLPMLNVDGYPLYVIHRSMIDKFIVNCLRTAPDRVAGLTLADLLADSDLRTFFESTSVVVNRQATLAEAKSAMLARPGCSDVFVTEGGGRNEPVVGWLTNVDIGRSS